MALLQHRLHEDRPWGSFDQFTHNDISTVKIITVAPHKRLSLQYHEKRSEFWRVLGGSGTVQIGNAELHAEPGDEFEIAPKDTHRLTGGPEGLVVLEIAVGEFDENDIVRLQDDFGRPTPASHGS